MIDIIFLLFIVCLILIGFYKGFFYILINFISIFTGIYLAIKFNNYLIGLFSQIFKTQELTLKILSFLFIFLFSVSTFSIIHKILEKIIHQSKILTLTNRLTGAFMGLLIGLFCLYYFSIIIQTNKKLEKAIFKDSKIYEILKNRGDSLLFKSS